LEILFSGAKRLVLITSNYSSAEGAEESSTNGKKTPREMLNVKDGFNEIFHLILTTST
jgi:hypothetical protein